MKKVVFILLKVSIVLVILYLIYILVSYLYYSEYENETNLTITNTNASIYESEEIFLDTLKDIFDEETYNEILKNNTDTNDSSNYNFYIVPGMESTLTINKETKTKEICSSMTPQGMAVTDEYIFISSYCHTHKHNSVIYLISRKTGDFIKEIILPTSSHVGGLAYDYKNNKLWITEYKNNKAYISSIALQKIEEYTLNEVITYDDEVLIKDLLRTSFITYYDDYIASGYFSLTDKGKLNVYPIKNSIINSKPTYKKIINSKVQGVAIYDDFIALSTSYSINKSKLLLFDETSLEDDLTEENATIVYTLPEKLEQIYIYDNKIYMLFESAAFNYRFRSNDVIDRIITFNIE